MFVQLNDLQKAVPHAHTFLQKNPEDQEMQQLMEEYKSKYDLSGYLTDHEEQPYEVTAALVLIQSSAGICFCPLTVSIISFSGSLS